MLGVKVSLIIGTVAGGVVAALEIGYLAISAQATGAPAPVKGADVIITLGAGSLAGFAATLLTVGSYKNKVDAHAEAIKGLEERKADVRMVDEIKEQIGEIQRNTRVLIRHAIRGGSSEDE